MQLLQPPTGVVRPGWVVPEATSTETTVTGLSTEAVTAGLTAAPLYPWAPHQGKSRGQRLPVGVPCTPQTHLAAGHGDGDRAEPTGRQRPSPFGSNCAAEPAKLQEEAVGAGVEANDQAAAFEQPAKRLLLSADIVRAEGEKCIVVGALVAY